MTARRLREIIRTHDTEPTELAMGLLALLWGLWLLAPWSTYGASPAWRVLAELAPETVWGLAFVALGLAQLVICIYATNGPTKYAAMVATGMWGGVTVSFMLSNPLGTGPLVYSLITLANAWIYLRQARVRR